MENIRAIVQRKLAAQSELSNDSVVSLAEETRRKFSKMLIEYEDDDVQSVSSTPAEITKYNNKFQDLDYLSQARTKINDLTAANDRLSMRLLQSDKHILAFKERLDEERSRLLKQEDQMIVKFKKEKEEMEAEHERKLENKLKQIEKLLEEKMHFNEEAEKFIEEKKELRKALAEQKQKSKIELKNKISALEASEKEKRIKWEETKMSELKETAITGLEPQLNSIISRAKNDIAAAEQRCNREKQEHREECLREFERKVKQFREDAFREHDIEKEKMRVEYSSKLKEQYDKMEREFSSDREKMRQDYKVEIEQEKDRRKSEQEDFIRKRRQLDTEHLDELKRFRQDYEERIRTLESGREGYLQAQRERLEKKYKGASEEEVERVKREEKEKLKNAYIKMEEKFQKEKEEYINSIAEMNSELERDLEKKFEGKRKDEKKLFEDTIRKLNRDVSVLEEKVQRQSKTSGDVTREKDQFQSQYLELKVKYDEVFQTEKETKLKVKQLQRQLDTLRGQVEQETELKLQAERAKKEKELQNLRKVIEKQEEDRVLLSRSHQGKLNECEKKWSNEILDLQSRTKRVIQKKSLEIDNLKKEVKKKEQIAKEYEGMLEKQRQQLMASLYK